MNKNIMGSKAVGHNWELLKVLSGRRARAASESVWLGANKIKGTDKLRYSVVFIAGHLAAEVGFKPDDRVNIYRDGPLYKISKSSTGLLRLTRASRSPNCTLRITNVSAASTIHAQTKADTFYAWSDAGDIYFIFDRSKTL